MWDIIFGFRISDSRFRIPDFGFPISDFGFPISDFLLERASYKPQAVITVRFAPPTAYC
jgi:hypothetical protein